MEDRNLQDQYFGRCKTGIWRTILKGWKMQDGILKDYFVGAMA